jgi:hypothetical protein
MSIAAWLGVAVGLTLVGCSSPPVLRTSGSTVLTAATVSTAPLDDDQIASIARKIAADQRALAALAAKQGADPGLRLLARRFAADNAATAPLASKSPPRPTALEDDLVERDVALELSLARYGGASFDRRFIDADAGLLDADVALVARALAPRASDPALREELVRLGARLSDELRALRSMARSEGAR